MFELNFCSIPWSLLRGCRCGVSFGRRFTGGLCSLFSCHLLLLGPARATRRKCCLCSARSAPAENQDIFAWLAAFELWLDGRVAAGSQEEGDAVKLAGAIDADMEFALECKAHEPHVL